MIGKKEFGNLLVDVLNRNIDDNLNQKEAILAPLDES